MSKKSTIAALAGSLLLVVSGTACDQFGGMHDAPDPFGITGDFEETGFTSWTGVVGLHITPPAGDPFICSGTLLDPNVVLTAGHCVYEEVADFDIRDNPGAIEVRAGAHILQDGSWEFLSSVSEIAVHDGWTGAIGGESVDFAMLRLTTSIVHLPSYGVAQPPSPSPNTNGIVVGYGNGTPWDWGTQGVHRAGETKVQWVEEPNLIHTGDPCGICFGDSGGPLFTEQGGDWVVTGVASHISGGECLPTYYNWHANVPSHRFWIEEIVNDWTLGLVPDAGVDGGDFDTDYDGGGDSDADADTDWDAGDNGDTDEAPHMDDVTDCKCVAAGSRPAAGAIMKLLLLWV